MPALRIFKIRTFQILYLANLAEGYWVQHSQWRHLVENINLYKSIACIFTPALIACEILKFKKVDHDNLGQGHGAHHEQ